MASVQELLLAAQAKQKKHPLSMLAELIDAGSAGYSEGIDLRNKISEADLRRAEISRSLVKDQMLQQELEQGKQTQDMIRQIMGIKSEQSLRDSHSATGTPPSPTTPIDKFDKEISIESNGKMSVKLTPKKATTKPPAGFRFTNAGDLEAIPGGPADIKSQTAKAKADLALASQTDKAKNVMEIIDEALPLVSNWSTGYGSLLKNIPLTDANALQAKIKTIAANLGIDQMMEMKAASASGASGLGALSEKELEVITNIVTNLQTEQDPPTIKKNLEKLKTHYGNWLELQKGNDPYRNSSPTGTPAPADTTKPKPTMRWNPATKKLEKL